MGGMLYMDRKWSWQNLKWGEWRIQTWRFLVLVGSVGHMSSRQVPQVVRASGWVQGKSSWSLGVPVQDSVRDIQDPIDLPVESGVRRVRVPAKPVVGVKVQVAVGRIGRLLLQTPNLGSILCSADRPECRSGERVAAAVILTCRRLVPPILQTVQRRHRCRQKVRPEVVLNVRERWYLWVYKVYGALD